MPKRLGDALAGPSKVLKGEPVSGVKSSIVAPLPVYVLTIPQVVSSDGEENYSTDEELEEQTSYTTFPDAFFDTPEKFFRLSQVEGVRGTVLPSFSAKLSQSPIQKNHPAVKRIVKKIEGEGFSDSSQKSKKIASQRLGIHIGLNRMRSLRSRVQKKFNKEGSYYKPYNASLSVSRFLWDAAWQKKDSDTGAWKKCDYEEVRAFYKELKKRRGVDRAILFSKKIEHAKTPRKVKKKSEIVDEKSHDEVQGRSTRSHQVPYREIREELKNSKNTKKLTKELRKEGDAYLGILDGDAVSLRAQDGQGVFTHYDRIITDHRKNFGIPLEVASTGYRLAQHTDLSDGRMIAFASQCDLWARHATAKIFPDGVYYPEPNSIVRILPDKETVEESFTENKNYQSPQEMVILVENVKANRKLIPKDSMIYDAKGAITTETPARMKMRFISRHNRSDKIIHWNHYELKKALRISQSHANAFSWAQNLLRALKKKVIIINNREIYLNKSEFKSVAVSLLYRLFDHYDVVNAAYFLSKEIPQMGYRSNLISILDGYTPDDFLIPVKRHSVKSGELQYVFDVLDRIATLSELKKYLSLFFNNDVDKILEAARSVSVSNSVLLRENLCRNPGELFFENFKYYFLSLGFVDVDLEFPNEIRPVLFEQGVIRKDSIDIAEVKKKISLDIIGKVFPFNTHLIHWAAFTGNHTLILAILSKVKKGDREKYKKELLEKRGDGNVLPIHCAIKYFAEEGVSLPLADLLLNDVTAVARTSDNNTPLVMALSEVEEPSLLLALFKEYYSALHPNEDVLWDMIEQLAGKSLGSRQNILMAILMYFPPGPDRQALFLRLLSESPLSLLTSLAPAVETLTDDMNLSKYFVDELYQSSPLLEILAQKDVSLFKAILDAYPTLSLDDVVDNEDRSAIWVAMDCLEEDQVCDLIPVLVNRGSDPNRGMCDNETCPIHEVMAPYNMDNEVRIYPSFKVFKILWELDELNRDVEDPDGKTPFDLIFQHQSYEDYIDLDNILKYLVDTKYIDVSSLSREKAQIVRDLGPPYDSMWNESEEESEDEKGEEEDRKGLKWLLGFSYSGSSEEEQDEEEQDEEEQDEEEQDEEDVIADEMADIINESMMDSILEGQYESGVRRGHLSGYDDESDDDDEDDDSYDAEDESEDQEESQSEEEDATDSNSPSPSSSSSSPRAV